MPTNVKIDEIGYWSEIKLDILREYAKPYNTIIRNYKLKPIYIDGFAGAGHHKAKGSDRLIDGSPKLALAVSPPFEAFHFVDMDGGRVDLLKKLAEGHTTVTVHHGNCNDVLVGDVFPTIRYDRYERALCVLDPYGLDLDWQVIKAAADTNAIEIFLNFPVMDMNRNVFWHDFEKVSEASQARMTRFWGDDSWQTAAYHTVHGLFWNEERRNDTSDVVAAFRGRLKKVAGFKHVPEPIPMRNSMGAIVYYLFFAAQQPAAEKIVKAIFDKYRHKGEANYG
jgi:three-Cys-motif partner protein